MDYSMLLGIEKKNIDWSSRINNRNSRLIEELIERKAPENALDAAATSRHQFCSPDLKYIYHISIIDYLQLWNFAKKAERFAKTKFLLKNGNQLSAVEPVLY
jgi:hypothetical protein